MRRSPYSLGSVSKTRRWTRELRRAGSTDEFRTLEDKDRDIITIWTLVAHIGFRSWPFSRSLQHIQCQVLNCYRILLMGVLKAISSCKAAMKCSLYRPRSLVDLQPGRCCMLTMSADMSQTDQTQNYERRSSRHPNLPARRLLPPLHFSASPRKQIPSSDDSGAERSEKVKSDEV